MPSTGPGCIRASGEVEQRAELPARGRLLHGDVASDRSRGAALFDPDLLEAHDGRNIPAGPPRCKPPPWTEVPDGGETSTPRARGLALLWWSTFAVPGIVPEAGKNQPFQADTSQLARSGKCLKWLNLLGFS